MTPPQPAAPAPMQNGAAAQTPLWPVRDAPTDPQDGFTYMYWRMHIEPKAKALEQALSRVAPEGRGCLLCRQSFADGGAYSHMLSLEHMRQVRAKGDVPHDALTSTTQPWVQEFEALDRSVVKYNHYSGELTIE